MKLYCMGDSLTFGYGVSRSCCWVRLLSDLVPCRCINMGICGDTTSGMRQRLEQLLSVPPESDAAVLLLGGYNDIFQTCSDASARENMAGMLQTLADRGIRALVLIPPALGRGGFPPEWTASVDFEKVRPVTEAYGRWLADFCRERQIPFADLRSAIGDDSSYIDGIHPNEKAHAMIARAVKDAI